MVQRYVSVKLPGESGHRRFRFGVVPPRPHGGGVTIDDVVHSVFGDPANGVPYGPPTQSLFAANDEALKMDNTGFDWSKGAVIHACSNPANGWSGAPWAYKGTTGYRYHNVWLEVVASALTQPRGVRVQYRTVQSWVLPASFKAWQPQRLTQADAGHPTGGYWHTSPSYLKTLDYGTNWRTEPDSNEGGWSMNLDPMTDSGGHLILGGTSATSVMHGPFSGWIGSKRVLVPTGGHIAISGWARLISDTGVDVSTAHYVGALSADAFVDNTTPPGSVTPSIVNTRHRRLTADWQWLGFVSGSESMIRNQYPKLPFLTA